MTVEFKTKGEMAAAGPKAKAPKTKKAQTKAAKAEWWATEPVIPKREPAKATLTLNAKEAKRFAEVLLRVVDATGRDDSRAVLKCVQMQTIGGLRLVAADGYRLAVAEYRPGLRGARNKVSNILARPALFPSASVLGIAKVLKGTSGGRGWATLEVKRRGDKRTLGVSNDKGEAVLAGEQSGNFPNWRKLPPTEQEAEPAAMNGKYLQWVARFCKAITCDEGGIVLIRRLSANGPGRFDATSDDYRGVAVTMPIWVQT